MSPSDRTQGRQTPHMHSGERDVRALRCSSVLHLVAAAGLRHPPQFQSVILTRGSESHRYSCVAVRRRAEPSLGGGGGRWWEVAGGGAPPGARGYIVAVANRWFRLGRGLGTGVGMRRCCRDIVGHVDSGARGLGAGFGALLPESSHRAPPDP